MKTIVGGLTYARYVPFFPETATPKIEYQCPDSQGREVTISDFAYFSKSEEIYDRNTPRIKCQHPDSILERGQEAANFISYIYPLLKEREGPSYRHIDEGCNPIGLEFWRDKKNEDVSSPKRLCKPLHIFLVIAVL